MRWNSGFRRSMELWRLSFLALLAGALVHLGQVSSARRRPNRCDVNLDPVGQYTDSARMVSLTSRCTAASINWRNPNNGQIITFYRRHRSFTVCMKSTFPGGTVYRLRGSSKLLVAESNRTGKLGCFESQCSHVSLLIEADNQINPNRLKYRYQAVQDYRCPLCTETCQRHCMCKGAYSFTGRLKSSRYENGIYTNYFKVSEYRKYAGQFVNESLDKLAYCTNSEKDQFNSSVNGSMPIKSDLMRVQSKCAMKIGKTYFVSTQDYSTDSKERLILCCASEDEAFANSYLDDVIRRKECCDATSRIDALNSTRWRHK